MQNGWVLVTGATSGMGLATALLFALEGYQVIATGRSLEKLETLQKAAQRANTTIRQVVADVSDEASIQNLRSEVLALTDGYGIDILVNNAGYAEAGAIEEIPLDRLRQQFETNVFGLVSVTQSFLTDMRKRNRGRIVNVSSILGIVTIPLLGAYAASKHAVEAISDALRVELSDTKIKVVTVGPGSVKTNFGETLIGHVRTWMQPGSPYESAYQKFLTDRGNERGVDPLDVAKVILSAVRSENPKPRYSPTPDAKMFGPLSTVLPTKTMDKVLRRAIMGR